MKIRKWKKIIALIGGIVVVALVLINIIDIKGRSKRLASMLNIASLPTSVSVVDCKDGFIPTDVVVTCSIELDPKDFPQLLRGYKFVARPIKDTSYSAVSTKLGPEFPVTTEFTAEPKEFKHGGHIKLFADQEQKRAVIDLYIE